MSKGRKKMKRFEASGSGKSTENESQQVNKKTDDFTIEKKACSNMHEETNIFSQIQMMSDSLAAYSKMYKYRPYRKPVKINDSASTQFPPFPQSALQILLPTSDRTLDGSFSNREESVISSYIEEVEKKGEKSHKRTSFSREEVMSKSNSNENFSRIGVKFHRKSLKSNSHNFRELGKDNSTVRIYEPGNVIPERMIDIIQRELKTLMELSPSLAYLLLTMSDTMFHYKACSKCRKKTYPAFPWILNRLQKLIKFIITKRHGTYFWPNDYSYLRLVIDEANVDEPEDKDGLECKNIESLPDQKSDSSEEPTIQLESLEKIDPLIVTESLPGVQLFLKVESRQTKKRFFRKVSLKFGEKLRGEFPVVQLQDISHIPVVLILSQSPELKVVLKEKRAVSTPKLISHRNFLRFKFPSLVQKLISTPASWGRIYKLKKDKYKKNLFLLQRLKFFEQSANVKEKSNDKVSYFTKNILINFSELVFDFITEGEEEKMQMQKMRELEAEVKELKFLMLDVRRNQAELSKILLKKGISSPSLLRFTSPEMMQEEDWIINKLEEVQLHKTRIESLEALQRTVSDLKRKCNLKNRLILTLLKGFESNVPTEWWNEIMNLMFGESVEEDLNPEVVSGLVQKASFFLRNGELASSTFLPLTRLDEKPSKEEPIMKGNMGADVQENLKILSDLDDKWMKIMDDTLLPLDCQYPMRIFTYPAALQEHLSSSVRRLEYQVSILNVENERLWHEILDLKDVLKSSVKGFSQKILSHRGSDKQLSPISKPSGKTINITIQIAPDKDRRLSTYSEPPKAIKMNETSNRSASRTSKSCTLTKHLTENYFSNSKEKLDYEDTIQDKNITVLAAGSKPLARSERRHSTINFNYLDDLTLSPSISPHRQNEEKVKAILRGRTSSSSLEQVIADNSHFSERKLYQTLQPVPSMHMVNEATFNYLAGPSRRRLNDFFQTPLGIDLCNGQSDDILLSKERELRPIPEDEDDSGPRSSESVNEAIQHLRGRVRLIHKDVKVLKSKNDRIDKVLTKLVDDIKSNNESFDEIQKALYLKQ